MNQSNPASSTMPLTVALLVKWATLSEPPEISSTLGSVDQMKCSTPMAFAASTTAVPWATSSTWGPAQESVLANTPYAPSSAALSVSGLVRSAATTSSPSPSALSGLRVKARTLKSLWAWRALTTPPPWAPVGCSPDSTWPPPSGVLLRGNARSYR